MKRFAALFLLASFLYPSHTNAWTGQDADTGDEVEIHKGNLVRRGKTIEIYDVEQDEYHEVEVESIRRVGNVVEVEVYDPEKDESRTLEMEGR